MKAVVAPVEGNKVKLSIEVEEQEFEKAVDAAFRKIAREVRIPGFRPGKAPRRILEARLGAQAGRTEALRESLPDYYARAVKEHEVDAIAAPQIDITSGEDSGAVAFDAVVEVRPHLQLTGYQPLRVEVPSPVVSEEDISSQIDRLRSDAAELATVDRPARTGDHLTVDLHGSRDGQEVSGMSLDDYLYELGSGSLLPELDEQLEGAKPGDILQFDSESTGSQIRVLVKEVKEKVLPEVTDEWAGEASEFDTVEELRADIVKRLDMVKRVQATMALRNGTVEALVQLVAEDPPQALIDADVEQRAHDLGHRLEAQGATIQQYIQATGQSEEQIVAELRGAAVPAVKADLALRAVADAESLEPTDAELDEEMARLAERYQLPAAQLRSQLERAEQMPAVRSDLRKSKALEWLIEHAEVVDSEGTAIDRALLEPVTEPPEVPETPSSESAPESIESSESSTTKTETGEA